MRVGHEFERLTGQRQPQVARGILEHRSQLHELGHERSQPAGLRQPPGGQRNGHPGARAVEAERCAGGRRGRLVANVDVGVGLVARGGEEPRLHQPPLARALDPSAALGEPHVAQPATEQAALAVVDRTLAERSQAAVDKLGVDALAVVGADDLVAPVAQRRHTQPAELGPPAAEPVAVGWREGQLDAAHRPPGGGDRRIGIRHELRDDLNEVDPALGEVLAKVAAAHAAVADGAGVEHHRGL